MRKVSKIDISIIIVNYHVQKELFDCIQSILHSKTKKNFEIIVVDNDEKKIIAKDLHKQFPKVIYIPNENKGYGQGNNVGAQKAKGKYLFILNPDTKLLNNTIDLLIDIIEKDKNTAIVAPVLYDKNNQIFPLQGASILTPLSAIFSFSFVHKLFPKNTIFKKYWLTDWDKKTLKQVQAVPGTAFLIRKEIFDEIKGFDEKFFLYYEEIDLCKRISDKGLKIFMYPAAKIFHAWGSSTDKSRLNANKIFLRSRYYYLKKHFGLLSALATEAILRFNKYKAFLLGILLFSGSVTAYRIDELMTFIGDQGWYYLSARGMVLNGSIPLVGIPSSHPWLHQGAYWTYILAPLLWISHFNPLSGAYFSIFFHLATIIILYVIAARLFSERIALFTAMLYACSPLIIIHARMPYHTTPIPLLTILFFYSTYSWVKGNSNFFPLIIFLLALLYNFEIATFLLTIVLAIILAYGFIRKKVWFRRLFTKKIFLLSLLGFVIPMLPMLIYDVQNGFPQTLLFLAWVGYKILKIFGYQLYPAEPSRSNYTQVFIFIINSYTKLVYWASNLVAFTIGIFSFGLLTKILVEQRRTEIVLLALVTAISIIGIIVTSTTSDAYLPILFPFIPLITAIFFDRLLVGQPRSLPIVVVILAIIVAVNTSSLLKENYSITKGVQYSDKIRIMEEVIKETGKREYNLEGRGGGSEHQSFTMSYEYLAWWLGKAPSKQNVPLHFVIEETPHGIIVERYER